MSAQSEALRLAAELEACPTINYKTHAAELRRLYDLAMELQGRIYALEMARSMEQKTAKLKRDALAEPVQEPYCHVYEYDSVFGLHREFYPREYNGRKPDRTVPLFTAPPQRKPPTNQCGETCERAKLCAVCARGLADGDNLSPTEPVQEPVAAWENKYGMKEWEVHALRAGWMPAPPQRKPLTEEEIGIICASLGFAQISPVEVARAIERAHGITS